jgi:phosphoserine phosphatase
VPVRDLQRLSPRVLAGVLPRLYPQMLARAYAHQDAGVPVYILTAASQEMADLLAHVLAFDGGLGSRSEILDGRYTGRPAGPFNYRDGKVASMRELAERDGIELELSFAYSDSESDLPMLRAVGNPVVVNPDAELRRIAAEEGWEVLHLDRLHQRLKVLAALAGGAALASLGSVVRERSSAATPPRGTSAGTRALQSRPPVRFARSRRPRGARRGASR